MSSDGTYSSRGSRRADRDAPAAKRASAGAAAAILIITALLGFGGGALLGNAGGDDPQAPVAETPDGTSGTDQPDESPGPDDEETPAAGDGTIVVQSAYDGGQATAANGGDCGNCDLIDLAVEAPSLAGETLWLERSLDGGATWEQFGTSPRSVTLDSNGGGSDQIFSGRDGENQFRYVLRDGDEVVQASNVVVVELVPQG